MKIPPFPLWGGLFGVCLFLSQFTFAMIDSTGKGMSDLWQWKYLHNMPGSAYLPPPGTTAIMNDLDDPYFQISHYLGAEGATITQTSQFREFARTQIGSRWYRCSDFYLSEAIFRAKKENGQWVDNGSEFILGNGQFPRP